MEKDISNLLDLISVKASGLKLPEVIKVKDIIFKLHTSDMNYYDTSIKRPLCAYINFFNELDERVEVIDYEIKDKQEPIEMHNTIEAGKIMPKIVRKIKIVGQKEEYTGRVIDEIIINKVNELVEEINKMKGC